MNYSLLQYFKTVAETQNFTKAAQALSISQPALSQAMKALQAEIGCSLFDYKGRGIELNEYGRIFLEYVTDALNALDEGKNKIQRLTSRESGTVRLSCLYSLGVNMIPYIVKEFRKSFPQVTLQLSQHPTMIQLGLLEEGKVDLCFCTDFHFQDVVKDPSIQKTVILIEDLYLLVNRTHRLAHKEEVELRDLDREDFIAFSNLTLFQNNLDKVFYKMNIHPHTVYEANEDGTVAAFVAAGLGVAVIPPILGVDFSKCVARKISYPILQRTLCMAWNKRIEQHPSARNFRDFVIKWLPSDKKYNSPSYP